MAKKTSSKTTSEQPTFETSLGQLDQIVADLEQGDIGLAEALTRYEEGVKLLGNCYSQLEKAEARIELLSGVDADGNPVTRPFDDEQGESLEEKAAARSRRRSKKKTSSPSKTVSKGSTDAEGDVDTSGTLF